MSELERLDATLDPRTWDWERVRDCERGRLESSATRAVARGVPVNAASFILNRRLLRLSGLALLAAGAWGFRSCSWLNGNLSCRGLS